MAFPAVRLHLAGIGVAGLLYYLVPSTAASAHTRRRNDRPAPVLARLTLSGLQEWLALGSAHRNLLPAHGGGLVVLLGGASTGSSAGLWMASAPRKRPALAGRRTFASASKAPPAGFRPTRFTVLFGVVLMVSGSSPGPRPSACPTF